MIYNPSLNSPIFDYHLPVETWSDIFLKTGNSGIDPESAAKVSQCCILFNEIIQDQLYWKVQVYNNFEGYKNHFTTCVSANWKIQFGLHANEIKLINNTEKSITDCMDYLLSIDLKVIYCQLVLESKNIELYEIKLREFADDLRCRTSYLDVRYCLEMVDEYREFEVHKRYADQGNTRSQYDVGIYYQKKIGMVKNEEMAFKYFELAANQGYGLAQEKVGFYYFYGVGVDVNKEEAFRYFKLAADRGSPVGKKYIEFISNWNWF